MAVHELYLSFEARLAPALHTIDDPNHDGHIKQWPREALKLCTGMTQTKLMTRPKWLK